MLRAGFAETDITPDRSCSLMGYEFRVTDLPPGNDGVNDPLHARVLALRGEGGPALLVSVDLCLVPNELARPLRSALAERVGTTAERVVLSATHTHSGPLPLTGGLAKRWKLMRPRGSLEAEIGYGRLLREKLLDAATRAAALTFPVDVSVRQAPLGLGYDRRVVDVRGRVTHRWSPQERPELDPRATPDPTCTVLVLRQAGAPRKFIIWNVGFHPVVLGKTSRVVSADYPGRACSLIEEAVPGSRAMFLLGAAGDSHPWIATREDPAGVETVARAAASFVALLTHATRSDGVTRDGADLVTASKTVRIGRHAVPLAAWRIGSARLLTAPVELFGDLSRDLRERVEGPLLLATVTNGWTGYCPTRQAFDEGGYEVDSARSIGGLRKGDGERLVEELVRVAEALR
jgi:hypothetical protein